MNSILSAIVVLGAGIAGLRYFMPRNGRVHPTATMPVLDSLIPILIVAALGVGVALIIAGVARMAT